jgi:hypothetical protein
MHGVASSIASSLPSHVPPRETSRADVDAMASRALSRQMMDTARVDQDVHPHAGCVSYKWYDDDADAAAAMWRRRRRR